MHSRRGATVQDRTAADVCNINPLCHSLEQLGVKGLHVGPLCVPTAECSRHFAVDEQAVRLVQVRLSRDVEGEAPYLSALAAFRSRTAYANSGGEPLVGPLPAIPRSFRL